MPMTISVFRSIIALIVVMTMTLSLFATDPIRGIGADGTEDASLNRLSDQVSVLPIGQEPPTGNAGLFIGVNHFVDGAGLRSLRYAVNDAIAQAYLFVVELRLIPPENCVLALAGEPTGQDIQRKLRALENEWEKVRILGRKPFFGGRHRLVAAKTSILQALGAISQVPGNDSNLVIVSISSHGFERDRISYVMPGDGLFNFLDDTALRLDTVKRVLSRAQAGKRLLLVDACRERPLTQGPVNRRDLAMSRAFRQALEITDGLAVLASCDVGQLSYEDPDLGHGVFTYYMLQALRGGADPDKHGMITLGSVSDFVTAAVQQWSRWDDSVDKPQKPWFQGSIKSRGVALARHRLDFDSEVDRVLGTVKRMVDRKGPYTPTLHDALSRTLRHSKGGEEDKKLLGFVRSFAEGRFPKEVFIPYLRSVLMWRPDPMQPSKPLALGRLADVPTRTSAPNPSPTYSPGEPSQSANATTATFDPRPELPAVTTPKQESDVVTAADTGVKPAATIASLPSRPMTPVRPTVVAKLPATSLSPPGVTGPRAKLFDLNWIQWRLKDSNFATLLADYDRYADQEPALQRIRKALEMSAHILESDPEQLWSQMRARLMNERSVGIDALLSVRPRTACLETLTPSFSQSQSAFVRTLPGHEGGVTALTLANSGRYLISGGTDRTVRVWNIKSGKAIQTLRGHEGWVTDVSVSKEGSNIVSASLDGTIGVWSLANGEHVRSLKGHKDWVRSARVTPNGHFVVSGSDDTSIKIWYLQRGQPISTLKGHDTFVNTIAISSNNRLALSGADSGLIRVWDIELDQEMGAFKGHEDAVNAVEFTPNDELAVSGSADGTARVWRISDGQTLRTMSGHSGPINDVCITPNGRYVLTVSDDHNVRMWELESGLPMATLRGHTAAVQSVTVSPEGRFAFTGSMDGTIRVWDLTKAPYTTDEEAHAGRITAVDVSHNSGFAVSSSVDGTIKVWDWKKTEELRTLRGHTGPVNCVQLLWDGNRAISGSDDGTIRVWNIATGRVVNRIVAHTGRVVAVADMGDGRRVASAGDDGSVHVWDLGREMMLRSYQTFRSKELSLTVSESGRQLLISAGCKTDRSRPAWGRSEQIQVLDINSGQVSHRLAGHTESVSAVRSVGHLKVISSSLDGTIRTWNLQTGESSETIYGDGSGILAIASSHDLQTIAASDTHKQLKVMDMRSGDKITAMSFDSTIRAVTFTPDNQVIIVGDDLGQVHFVRFNH